MTPNMTTLDTPEIIKASRLLLSNGTTQLSDNHLFYLNIDDAYIHQLFPLLQKHGATKPDYFNEKGVGAHITIAYPEECKKINKEDLSKEHHFQIKRMVMAKIGKKKYYALLVDSFSLLQLRQKYHLPPLLCFKGYDIGFHITIGVKET
jgi:hypothetical protein